MHLWEGCMHTVNVPAVEVTCNGAAHLLAQTQRGDSLRVQPLMFSVTMPRKFQKPGSQRSHFCPPTPGLQEHCAVTGSHVPL